MLRRVHLVRLAGITGQGSVTRVRDVVDDLGSQAIELPGHLLTQTKMSPLRFLIRCTSIPSVFMYFVLLFVLVPLSHVVVLTVSL